MLYRLLPMLLCLAIIAASISLSALQLYPLLHTRPEPASTSTSNISKAAQPLQQAKPNRNIASFSLFGDFNAEQVEQEPILQDLPKTQLRLTLTGVSANKQQEKARALIEGPDRSTESYRVGDSLPGNASLHSVHKDRIILSRSGKLETLFFPDAESGTRLLASTMDESASIDSEIPTNIDLGQNPATAIQIPKDAPNITPAQKKNIRDKLSALRARLKNQ